MEPIVHVGYHKTGTSWFQSSVYPSVTTHALADRRTVREVFLAGDAFDFDPAYARDRLDLDKGTRPALICEEDLSGVLHNGTASGFVAREVARRLHATMPDARIVLFVRAQGSAALSWYLQYLREGGTRSIRRYLFPELYRHLGHVRPFKLPHFDFSQLDYRGLVQRYDDLFGRERVLVLPYEALLQDSSDLLAQMGAALGVTLVARSNGRSNAGYRRGLVPLIRAANLFTRRSVVDKTTLVHLPYWYVVRKELFEQLNRLSLFGVRPRPEAMLGPEIMQWIAQRFHCSNRWLASRMGWDLAALGYALDPPSNNVRLPAPPLLAWTRF